MSTPNRKHHRPAGFSLVELMVALVISLVLIGGVIKIYLGSKQSYRVQDNQARLQENGRMALFYLTKDLRMAGYTGCYRNINVNIIANAPIPAYGSGDEIQGYDTGTWPPTGFPATPTSGPGTHVANTDAVLVRYAYPYPGIYITGNMGTINANIQLNAIPPNLVAGDDLFITDCSHADLFQATNVSSGSGGIVTIAHSNSHNTQNFLSQAYTTSAQLMAYQQVLYYVGTTSTPGVYGLFRIATTDPNSPEELVDGLSQMKILYGVDTTGDSAANEYLTASQVNAISPTTSGWPDVVSVRVNLLLETPQDHLTRVAQVYRFDGGTGTAPDHRLYAGFGDTVTLRNRTP